MAEQTVANEAAQQAETTAVAVAEATWTQTRAILRIIFIVIVVAAGMWLLYALEGVLLLVVLSIFFAYLLSPLVDLVRRPFKLRGGEYTMPRVLAVGIVYLIIFGALAIALYFLIPRVVGQVDQFIRQSSNYVEVLQGRTRSLYRLTERMGLPPAAQTAVVNGAPRAIEAAREYLGGAAAGAVEMLAYLPWLVLIPILGFFLLKDAEGFRDAALRMLPHGRLRWRGDEFFQDVNTTLAAYIRAQLIACLFIGVVCAAAFFAIGINYWLALGILAGLLEFIPLAGPLTVLVVAVLVASFESPNQALAVFVFLVVLRIVHDYVIYPRIIGQGIHLHPLAVVLAILCGEELAGLAGIFLAIPAVAIISVTYRHWLEHKGSEGLVADLLKPADQALAAPPTTGNTAPAPAPVAPAPATTPQPAPTANALPQ